MDSRFDRVVIWGYPINTHTHSFIHYSFEKGFRSIGYETHWMTDEKNQDIDFSRTLFIASGEQEKKIPLRKDCYYVLHNVDAKKYLDRGCKVFSIQVHTSLMPFISLDNSERINSYTLVHKGDFNTLFTCWATDLLPQEIDLQKAENQKKKRECLWVGTFGDSTGQFQNGTELDPFFKLCEENGIFVKKINPWAKPISFDENRRMVNDSFLSPSIQGPWQVNQGYIPCRIFKNISYGHMGYTNSPAVNNIFSGELIFARDTKDLFYSSLEFKEDPTHIERLKYLMNEVKEKHTYINRINQILEFLPE